MSGSRDLNAQRDGLVSRDSTPSPTHPLITRRVRRHPGVGVRRPATAPRPAAIPRHPLIVITARPLQHMRDQVRRSCLRQPLHILSHRTAPMPPQHMPQLMREPRAPSLSVQIGMRAPKSRTREDPRDTSGKATKSKGQEPSRVPDLSPLSCPNRSRGRWSSARFSFCRVPKLTSSRSGTENSTTAEELRRGFQHVPEGGGPV